MRLPIGTFDLDERAIADLTFQCVDEGTGSDTLTLNGAGHSLDLTSASNLKITSIEKIDITGSGANTLTLKLADVLDISDTISSSKTRLLVDGGADSVGTSGVALGKRTWWRPRWLVGTG